MRYACLLVACVSCFAQDALTARQILEKSRAGYTGLRRCEIEGRVEMSGVDVPFRMAFEYPDKLRIEDGMGTGPKGTLVTDGKTTWRYDPDRNAYTRKAGIPELDLDMSDDELKRMGIDPSGPDVVKFAEVMLAGFRKVADSADRATLLRTETLRPGGAACYVILIADQKTTVWIDTKLFRIMRLLAGGERIDFTTVRLNEPLPGGLFTSRGARLVEELE